MDNQAESATKTPQKNDQMNHLFPSMTIKYRKKRNSIIQIETMNMCVLVGLTPSLHTAGTKNDPVVLKIN